MVDFSAIVADMQMETVEALSSLAAPLDFFSQTRLPDDALIEFGLVVPLPLAAGAPATAGAPPERLIWGAPIVRRAVELAVRELPVSRLPRIDDRAALLLVLRLESRSGAYSWSEREAIQRYLTERGIGIDCELSRAVTGDESFGESMARYLRLAPRWRRAVDEGTVDVRTAEGCGALPAEVLEVVVDSPRRISFSNRRMVLSWLSELCGRDGLHQPALLRLAADVMQSADPVETLRRLRYPRLSTMEERFAELRKRLTAGAQVNIAAPPNFEGEGFELRIKLRGREDIDRAIETLHRMQEQGDELFELL